MSRIRLPMMVLLGSLTVLPAGLTLAADHEQGQDRNKTPLQEQDQDRDRIFGHEMMTDEERNEYMSRMHSATTAQERERIREENHQRMVERARERGITLPDEPMGGPMGSGKGMGSGMGGGGGSSGGMGGGMGRDNDHGNKK